jgi:nucleotide-binding universal stress UspA family protein
MSDKREEARVRRVVVALDTTSFGAASLEAAVRFAAGLGAELHGLFVEDIDLLRLAALPFAQEVASSSGALRRIELPAVEALLRAKVEARQQTLAAAAQEVGLAWSFQVVRGRVVETALATAAEADLLFLERQGQWPAEAGPMRPIVVLLSGAPADRQAMRLAVRLAGPTGAEIVVLVATASEDINRLREEFDGWSRQFAVQSIRYEATSGDAAAVAQTVCRRRGSVILIGSPNEMFNRNAIENLVNRVDCPLVLVRNSAWQSDPASEIGS